ncbi:MAG: sigma-70 family RNA polymerase sigma factor [Candidatus Riflebacteria bacterium]|nr:sigma-70 family RNA polymerase sigma factor [Candidatus Riflebacteria bacterium]
MGTFQNNQLSNSIKDKNGQDMLNELEVLESAKNGNAKAFDQIVQKYQQHVYRLAYRYFNNQEDAMDVSQEVFVKAFRALKGFEGRSSLKTWLLKITANTCSSLAAEKSKKNKSIIQYFLDWFSSPSNPGPEEILIDREKKAEAQEVVKEKISKLPEVYKLPLVLKDIEGMSIDQIAEVLDLKEGTVKSRINRGRRLLHESLESFYKKRYSV